MADEQRKSTPKIYVMPEQFLALTRAAGLPVSKAPPPPLAASPLSVRGGAGELAPAPKPGPVPPSPALPTEISSPKSQIPPGPGLPVEEGGRKKMIIVWGIVGVVILIGGGLAAFFALRSVPPPPAPVPPLSVRGGAGELSPEHNPSQPPLASRGGAPPPPPANIAPPTPEPEPVPAVDKDTDSDGLTDAEEILFSTDITLADTDRDGFNDALELANLYNPAGVAPQRLLDAGLVYEYEHPTQAWKMFLPRAWSIAATDQEQQQLIISTDAAEERVVVDTHENPDRLPIVAAAVRFWPAATAPDAASVRVATTKRGAEVARLSVDPIRALFLAGNRVVIVSHEVRSQPPRYPHVFDVLVQSFAAPVTAPAP